MRVGEISPVPATPGPDVVARNSRMVSGMSSWDDDERAALLALLRARPESMTWSRITSEVVDAGSARAVWERFGVPSPFGTDAELFHDAESEIESAKGDIVAWRSAEFDFITFRDDEYPRQLREVNQFPPFVFVRGTRVPPRERGLRGRFS